MDETSIEQFEQEFETALDNLPIEAKDFLYGEVYRKAMETLSKDFLLSEAKKSTLDFHLTRAIALLEEKDELLKILDSWNYSEEQKKYFVKAVEETVFMPLIEATNYVVENEEEVPDIVAPQQQNTGPSPKHPEKAPSPNDMLTILNERGFNPQKITPLTDIIPSLTNKPITTKSIPERRAGMVDPYREIPEK